MELSNITVLVVDGEVSSENNIINILSKYNFKDIYDADNAIEAIDSYKYYQPDIIIANHTTSTSDLLEMSKNLKQINPDIPIILIINIDDSDTIVKAINTGIDGCLFKPINLNKLSSLIEKHSKRILLQQNFKKEQKLLQEYKRAIDAGSSVSKTDISGDITYVNDSFCELSGYSKKELIGKSHRILRHPDIKPEVFIDMWRTISSKKVWKGSIKNIKKDGNVFFANTVIVPILNNQDEIIEYISFRQDITELYKQEQYLLKRIKKEVNKNIELHKKREEENLLEAKFSTIGRMAAGITHEINTPLTYAKGNLELMIRDIENIDDSIKQKEYLKDDVEIVLDGINRIEYIVESMREMASQTKEMPKINNVYSLLITSLTVSHNTAKFISKITVQDEIFTLGMDKTKYEFNAQIQPQRIEQVFVIIINNALDALQHIDNFEERLLKINIEEINDEIIIVFKDNGGGIDEEIMPKIFDPFQSNKGEGGMGIGLNVAMRIIEDHNGDIIPSNHKDGAEFKVIIPKINKVIQEYS